MNYLFNDTIVTADQIRFMQKVGKDNYFLIKNIVNEAILEAEKGQKSCVYHIDPSNNKSYYKITEALQELGYVTSYNKSYNEKNELIAYYRISWED